MRSYAERNAEPRKEAKAIASAAKIMGDFKKSVAPLQAQPNGLPSPLRAGLENLGGVGLGDVRVHRNSSLPAQMAAHAFTRGTDIHVAPGQGRYLPHEGWHAVQQKQGRVRPTAQLAGGLSLNALPELEREADAMGRQAALPQNQSTDESPQAPLALSDSRIARGTIQRKHITEDIKNLKDAGVSGMTALIAYRRLQEGKENWEWDDYKYSMKKYKFDAKHKNEDEVRNVIRNVGNKAASKDLLHKLEGNSIPDAVKEARINKRIAEHTKIAPFVLNVHGFETQVSGKKNLNKEMSLDVIFAGLFYGYVSRIDESKMFSGDKKPRVYYDPAINEKDAKNYSNKHDNESEVNLSESASAFIANATGDNADNLTKVIAEGARWRAVAELANRGNLYNDSIFYVKREDPEPDQISFKSLWGKWKDPFNKAWDISDATLKAKLPGISVEGAAKKKYSQLENDRNYGV